MKQPDLLERMKELQALDVETCRRKGADYSGTDDVFTSFNVAALCSGVPAENQFLYEIGKKISRIEKLLKKANEVADEGITDSIGDIRVYCYLFQVYLEQQNRPSWAEVEEMPESQT